MLCTQSNLDVLNEKKTPLRLHAFRAGLLALSLSAGCGDPVRPEAPTPDASTPDASTPPRSDAGEPDAGPCECPTGSRCVEGVCKETDLLQVRLLEHQSQEVDGGIAWTSTEAQSCFYGIGDGGVATHGPIRVEGACAMYGPIQDGGIVRGFIPIPRRGGMERMTIEPAMIRRGQPVQLRWPKGSGSRVDVTLAVGTATAAGVITCLLPGTGEYTVSARLSEMFGDGPATYPYSCSLSRPPRAR
ncbi:hypothetical protein COCOR_01485 [Corallococcus coralloides DSM 2259]|uniref:Uncharacterized protein n=1 Tax=Corallococcus coralloides (strain ATCC 25202 / DSM 2259 / NBRC 100086 / M2) TaxID=1144275 RepID=H8MVD5_CORCM|nr:hypothetical protein [Corallococcus coralloides]AFE04096.1 hypothetical protein COCOR_01485 [Corallococcus coralloides DSM 2259]